MAVVACPPNTPPVHGVVQFVFSEFATQMPEFAGINQAWAATAFTDATFLLSNSCRSPIRDANKRQYFLYLLTAHVCFLRFGSNDGAGNVTPAPGIVGRVSDAHEGSVSVRAEYSATNVPQGQAFYIQTRWGALYWQQTAKYRAFRYAPPPATSCGQCGGPLGMCSCGIGIGPVGTGFPGYNGGCS
jgi:hypothetical protein